MESKSIHNMLDKFESGKHIAKESGKHSKIEVSDHFADVSKMVSVGSGAERGNSFCTNIFCHTNQKIGTHSGKTCSAGENPCTQKVKGN